MARFMRKSFNATLVATTIFVFGATPAFATPAYDSAEVIDAASSVLPQELSTVAVSNTTPSLEYLLDLASIEDSGPSANFDVEAAIAMAELEIGTSRATGWGMPGECIVSAQRWITAGGGAWVGSGTPIDNYIGATRLPYSQVQAGDIIQYENLYAPHAWVTGVHTVLVTGVNEDGTIDIIQSNVPEGSGFVTKVTHWTPQPPEGFQAVVWRF